MHHHATSLHGFSISPNKASHSYPRSSFGFVIIEDYIGYDSLPDLQRHQVSNTATRRPLVSIIFSWHNNSKPSDPRHSRASERIKLSEHSPACPEHDLRWRPPMSLQMMSQGVKAKKQLCFSQLMNSYRWSISCMAGELSIRGREVDRQGTRGREVDHKEPNVHSIVTRTMQLGWSAITLKARCPLWSSDRSFWVYSAYYGSKVPVTVLEPIRENTVPTTGARCPLRSSNRFMGARCPLREQGARYSPRTNLWEQGAHYGSKVPITVLKPIRESTVPQREQGARYGPRTDSWEQGARYGLRTNIFGLSTHHGSKVPVYLPGHRALGVRCPFANIKICKLHQTLEPTCSKLRPSEAEPFLIDSTLGHGLGGGGGGLLDREYSPVLPPDMSTLSFHVGSRSNGSG
nr:hypothetical protein Iba_chr14bCG11230 [Ipomoea batatas]